MPVSPEPLQRIHVTLFEKDVEYITATWGDTLGLSKAIRAIVRNYLKKLDQKVQKKLDSEGE